MGEVGGGGWWRLGEVKNGVEKVGGGWGRLGGDGNWVEMLGEVEGGGWGRWLELGKVGGEGGANLINIPYVLEDKFCKHG